MKESRILMLGTSVMLRTVRAATAWIFIAGLMLTLLSPKGFAQQPPPQSAQPSKQEAAPSRPSAPTRTSCAPSYPQKPLAKGTRVVIVTSTRGVEGAQVYLDGKCQGLIKREAPNRNAYSLMVVNVPPGRYTVKVHMQGYRDFQTNVDVVAINQPPEKTPKVVVRFELQHI